MRYELILNGKNVATIPQESIKAFALMRQLDKKVTHGKIHDIATAIESLIDEGFEVKEIEEKPLTEIPKVPNRYNRQHRDLYDKLERKSDSELTEEERRFCITMYHMEEYACGLDG